MQTLRIKYMAVMKDYDHMTIIDENVNWMKLTYLLSMSSLNLKAPFVHLPLLKKN